MMQTIIRLDLKTFVKELKKVGKYDTKNSTRPYVNLSSVIDIIERIKKTKKIKKKV